MEKLQKFLCKDWLLIFSPILYFVGIVGMDTVYLFWDVKGAITYFAGHLFIASMVLVTCISYKKHNKNVMKAVLAAALAFVCSNSINNACHYILSGATDTKSIINIILSTLIAVSAIMFFINHLILASDHKSNPRMIGFNMITGICYVAFSTAWGLFAFACGSTIKDYLYAIFWIFFAIGSVILAINIETKVDYFKKAREEK